MEYHLGAARGQAVFLPAGGGPIQRCGLRETEVENGGGPRHVPGSELQLFGVCPASGGRKSRLLGVRVVVACLFKVGLTTLS